jgi:hypothetical protein
MNIYLVICIEGCDSTKEMFFYVQNFMKKIHIAKAKIRLTLSTQLYACELSLWEDLARKTFLNQKPIFNI